MPTNPATLRNRVIPSSSTQRRDLYFFGLYRAFEAALLALLLFTPASAMIGDPRHSVMVKAVVVFYLAAAVGLILWERHVDPRNLRTQVIVGTTVDIVVATLAAHALPQVAPGIVLMLLFNIGSASLLLPLRYGLGLAALAAAAVIGEYIWTMLVDVDIARPFAERLMFAVSFMAIAILTYLLGRQLRDSEALVEKRSGEVADLADLNELIIRRMRTGVLLVDGDNQIRLSNEAALSLLGSGEGERQLGRISTTLSRRLQQWRQDDRDDETPLSLGPEQTDILPRFVRLHTQGGSALVFLDDTSMVSRRAESLTLATLGRFSASLAHEIRNPLAAISYATQLLEESNEISAGDRRLLEIIHDQCLRTNGIVESVLSLARRERATPERIDLGSFVRRTVSDFKQVVAEEAGTIQITTAPTAVVAMADPRHMQQVLTVLLQNAMNYGHLASDPARITVVAHTIDGHPVIDVMDRGPGIAEGNQAQLFRPFFTTSEHGTGLGLYIAGELCRANDASLDYVPVPGGGSCFRIAMPAPHALMPADKPRT